MLAFVWPNQLAAPAALISLFVLLPAVFPVVILLLLADDGRVPARRMSGEAERLLRLKRRWVLRPLRSPKAKWAAPPRPGPAPADAADVLGSLAAAKRRRSAVVVGQRVV